MESEILIVIIGTTFTALIACIVFLLKRIIYDIESSNKELKDFLEKLSKRVEENASKIMQCETNDKTHNSNYDKIFAFKKDIYKQVSETNNKLQTLEVQCKVNHSKIIL